MALRRPFAQDFLAMKTVLALRHVAFEDLGTLAPILREHGALIRYVEAGCDDLNRLDPRGPDLLVILGGPIGVNDAGLYPFLRDELVFIERRLAAGRPTLGICLGAQLIAHALGARIYPAAHKELGWAPLTLTESGRRSCLRFVAPEETPVLHWHGDTFDLPAGAEHLAATDLCPHQAFSWGAATLALQFHLEVVAVEVERWLIGHTLELATTPGVTVPGLRAETRLWGARLERQARQCLESWLASLTPQAPPG
jgi:GMP synthase (glutamine-hydrolysing)